MKKLTKHLCDEMLIAQIIYKFNVNLSCRSCFKYFVEDEVWLNVCNLSITHLVIKLDDCNVDLFKIKRVFKNNSLIIKLNLLTFMKIYSIFHVILLSHIASVTNVSELNKIKALTLINSQWMLASSLYID